MSPPPLYRLNHIASGYGGKFQINIARLEIIPGEIFCLLGPTGAGKSTLLRMLAALAAPEAGDIQFQRRPLSVENLPRSDRRRIVMSHQHPILLNGTVRQNVEYPLRLRNVKPPFDQVDETLESLRLTKLANQSARTLSGGQTQLVALARALVVESDVVLLDEPTSHLDPAHVGLVERFVTQLQRQRGTTIIWSTHNLFQARRVADRVALIWEGQLVEVGQTSIFFESPSDPRTADFIRGKMIY